MNCKTASKSLSFALIFLLAVACAGQQKKPTITYPTLGSLEAKDPRFWQLIPHDGKIEILAEGFEWSEGPVWMPVKDYLLFSDVPTNTLYKWKEGEGASVFMKPSGYSGKAPRRSGGSNGLALDRKGRLILCEHGDRRVAKLESLKAPQGAKTTLADRYQGKRFNSPNDLVLHSNGDLYFTDPIYGLPKGANDPERELDFEGVFLLTTAGEVRLLTKEITRPNGIALSPNEEILYVANSDRERLGWYAFDVKDDGTLEKGRLFHDPAPWREGKKGGCDGMKVDDKGNLFATGPGGVCVFSPGGTHLGTINTVHPAANCAFGDDGTTLYITADMYLLRIKTKTLGFGY